MRTIQGVSVSAGIAIGTVRVLAAVDYAVERRLIDDPQAEMDRFRAARDTAVAQLKQLRDNVAAEFGENKAELFDAHRLMLQDPDYAECVEGLIAQDKVNAEFAVKSAAEQFAAMFAAMDSSTMQARAADVKDVSRRVMNVLQGKRDSTMLCRTVLCRTGSRRTAKATSSSPKILLPAIPRSSTALRFWAS